jgi:hypothetical protein
VAFYGLVGAMYALSLGVRRLVDLQLSPFEQGGVPSACANSRLPFITN